MKSAKIFFAGMYLHLLLSVAVPATILFAGEWEALGEGLFLFYLGFLFLLHIIGWTTVAMTARAGKRGETDRVVQAWKLLKLGSIPFFVMNFLYSAAVWFLIVAASRGIFAILLPIPIAFTWFLILETGCVGCFALRLLWPQLSPAPGKVHYFLQFLPVLDVFSTLMILFGLKKAQAHYFEPKETAMR